MTDKPQNLYLVKNSSGYTLHVWAVSNNQAKRTFCKKYGIHPGDYWCGITTLTARKLNPEEIKAWEAQAEEDLETLVFIRGMLEICTKAYENREKRNGCGRENNCDMHGRHRQKKRF